MTRFSAHKPLSRGHAIVIGGGMAGLLATRVLSDHFDQVTLLERDHYPKAPAFRSGVPQGRQVHTLLVQGQRILDKLFPGLSKQLIAQGAVERDYGKESLYYYGGRCPEMTTTLHGWNCSRLFLEWHIRARVAACSHVQIREGYEVVGLLANRPDNGVCGVHCRRHTQSMPKDEIQALRGDLVVDASGVTSRICHWLDELGYPAPKELVMNTHLGYATRFYEPPEQEQRRWRGIAIQATHQRQRGGSLMEIEGGRWMTVLAGIGKDAPSTEPEAYLAFAQSLPEQALYEAMQTATPISPIYGYRRTENRWRRFDQVRALPEGVIVMGDAVCVLNPLYGQGMTVAVLQAQMLARCLLSRSRKGWTRQFQRKAARVIALPWRLATAADGRMVAEKPTRRWSHRYIESLIELLPRDQHVLRTFLEVIHMVRSPLALMHPLLAVKVCRQYVRGQKRMHER